MTGLNLNAAPLLPDSAGDGRGWAPRLAQELRLRQLDDLLAAPPAAGIAIAAEIERAALLGALGRRQQAQLAF
ncbi:MAG: hypothetical protein ACREC2_17260, partial [Bradyrhizobium sp.]